jgi:hypothetical protein
LDGARQVGAGCLIADAIAIAGAGAALPNHRFAFVQNDAKGFGAAAVNPHHKFFLLLACRTDVHILSLLSLLQSYHLSQVRCCELL